MAAVVPVEVEEGLLEDGVSDAGDVSEDDLGVNN